MLAEDITRLDSVHPGDLEDLYYATVAKHKQLFDTSNILLTHGFKTKDDIYFRFLKWDDTRLNELSPITIEEFQQILAFQGIVLFHPAVKHLIEEGIYQKQAKVIGHKAPTSDDQYKRHVIPFALVNLRRRKDVRNMSSAMIYGELAEKHRIETVTVTHTHQSTAYVSPYNLEERTKKLDVSGGPNMPCICDPDCICTPLCASDPTQDCLCEENGLFARVTEGMDIDELDVPDLIRSKEFSSGPEDGSMAGSETSSLLDMGLPALEVSQYVEAWNENSAPAHRMQQPEEEVKAQKKEQRKVVIENISSPYNVTPAATEFADILSEDAIGAWNQFSTQHSLTLPPRTSSLSYRDALTQPFSKLCDTPPRRMQRSSFVKLLFTSTNSIRTQPGHSKKTVTHPTTDEGLGSEKVSKLGRKRGNADVDWANLKRVR